jgi:hypothetical protein
MLLVTDRLVDVVGDRRSVADVGGRRVGDGSDTCGCVGQSRGRLVGRTGELHDDAADVDVGPSTTRVVQIAVRRRNAVGEIGRVQDVGAEAGRGRVVAIAGIVRIGVRDGVRNLRTDEAQLTDDVLGRNSVIGGLRGRCRSADREDEGESKGRDGTENCLHHVFVTFSKITAIAYIQRTRHTAGLSACTTQTNGWNRAELPLARHNNERLLIARRDLEDLREQVGGSKVEHATGRELHWLAPLCSRIECYQLWRCDGTEVPRHVELDRILNHLLFDGRCRDD